MRLMKSNPLAPLCTAARPTRVRAGFTLGELLLSITITIAVFSAAVPFFTLQMRQLQQNLGRSDAQMTGRFAQNTIDRELRNIGIGTTGMDPANGIPRNQPKIVQAGPFSVTFNTDLIAADTVDIKAVYYDPNVPLALTTALASVGAITLPVTGVSYPDYVYRDGNGALSLAETISYWATVDSTSGFADEFILFKRTNNGPVSVVARGVRVPAGQSLFSYRRVNAAGNIIVVPSAQLPIRWNDASQLADSIRTVTISLRGIVRGYNLQNKPQTFEREVTSQTSLANIGLSQRNSCGDIPLDAGVPGAALVNILGVWRVQVTFGASGDEASGERDVERYAVFRRPLGGSFDEPVAAVGKSGGPYMWEDFNLDSGNIYEYGVAAQDCSPANSSIRTTAAVLHP